MAAALLAKSRLLFLGPELEPIADRAGPHDATNLAVDSHGRFVAVGTKTTETALFTRHGKPSLKLETRQPLAHLVFVPGLPMLVAASTFGLLVGVELSEVRLSAGLDAEILWEEKLGTGVGRLTCSGDGGLILASCFTHGVQRYDVRGQNEGSYHLGGTASHAVPDFAGRSNVVGTTEGELNPPESGGQHPLADQAAPLGRRSPSRSMPLGQILLLRARHRRGLPDRPGRHKTEAGSVHEVGDGREAHRSSPHGLGPRSGLDGVDRARRRTGRDGRGGGPR